MLSPKVASVSSLTPTAKTAVEDYSICSRLAKKKKKNAITTDDQKRIGTF